MNLKSALGQFRVVAIAEGISFLVLLFIAMPLKYVAGMPLYVKYTGWLHGLLFISYLILLIKVQSEHNWSLKKSIWAFIASLLPFGTFVLDKQIARDRVLAEEKVIGNQ